MTGLSLVSALQDDSLISCLPLLNNLLGTYKHHKFKLKESQKMYPETWENNIKYEQNFIKQELSKSIQHNTKLILFWKMVTYNFDICLFII